MISKGFLKSSFVYTLGGAMPMVASIILLPFYTDYLSELHFLQVAYYISISLLFQILFTYSLDTYFGVKYTQLNEQPLKQKEFIGTTSVLLLIIGAILLTVSALTGKVLFKTVFREDFQMQFWPYGFFTILTAFFNAYFKTATNSLIYLKKPGLFLTVNFLNLIATLSISIGGLELFPDSIIGPMYGRLLSGAIIFIAANYIFIRYGTLKFETSFLPELKKFCTPFLFYVLSSWVLSQIDRFMLQSYIPKQDINTYDLVLKCFFGIEFLQNSLSAVIFPKLYEIWSKQTSLHTTQESNRYFNVFTAINVLQLIVFCIAVPFMYKLIITKASFYEASRYIGLLAAGYGLRSILNYYLATILYTRNTLTLLKIFGISAVFQIGLTYYAAGNFGLIGVIYTGIITKVLQVILSMYFTKGIFRFEFNYFKIIVVPFLYLLSNIVLYYLFPEFSYWVYLLQLLVFSSLFFMLFRNEIYQVLKQFGVKRS